MNAVAISSIAWAPATGPLLATIPSAEGWISALATVGSPFGVYGAVGRRSERTCWYTADVDSVAVTLCHTRSIWSETTLLSARFPVTLGFGLKASGRRAPRIDADSAASPAEAERFLFGPCAEARSGLAAVLAAIAGERFVLVTDTAVFLELGPNQSVDDAARLLARFVEAVEARKRASQPPPRLEAWSRSVLEAAAAWDPRVDPRHDVVVLRHGALSVDVRLALEPGRSATILRLTFPDAIAPPFTARAASGLIPQIFCYDVAIGDSELDRKLDVQTFDGPAVGAVLRGRIRSKLLALRSRWPWFSLTERSLSIDAGRELTGAETAAVVEEPLAFGATLFESAPASVRPYR